MRRAHLALRWITALVAVAILALLLFALTRSRPQDVPWTRLDLSEPIGVFTGRKMAGLGRDFPKCRALLDHAGVRYAVLPARHDGACGYDDAVRFERGGSRGIDFRPAVGTGCAVAAGLAKWEWDVVQPAAIRHFGQEVRAIEHFGSYSCRKMRGRNPNAWSQHARARAIDIAAFRLADGTRISVLKDWKGDGDGAKFLKDVRNGGCRLFSIVLSPDYNAAHADHLHMDQSPRGEFGWRGCR